MSSRSIEERLVELESRDMHHENLLEKLNAVVIEQQATIERLRREVERLRAQFAQAGESDATADEPPPHY